MTPFEKHGIQHLSASSLNLFRSQPALWVLKYMLNYRDNAGPAAWRGSAVEAGLMRWLYEPNASEIDCLATAMSAFGANAQGEVSDEIEAEAANIAPMLSQAVRAIPDRAVPTAKQVKIETWIDGVACPFIGYADFLNDGLLTDLKTTKACPSEARPDHRRQIALYLHGRGCKEDGRLLYVTAKKSASFTVGRDEVPALINEIRRDAMALQRFLARVDDGKDAINILPADFDHFMWSDEARAFALTHSTERKD